MRTFLIAVVFLSVVTSEARAGWVRVSQSYSPLVFSRTYDPGLPNQFSEGWIQTGVGAPASGAVTAEDRSSGGGIPQLQLSGTGFSYESWKHNPPGVGEVELQKYVEITGEARLVNNDVAAGAFGTSRARHIFDGVQDDLVASLTHSASETVTGQLFTLTAGYNGNGINVNVAVLHHGAGKFSDDGGGPQYRTSYKCPVIIYEEDLRVSILLTAWANESLLSAGDARGDAEAAGYATITPVLISRQTCP